MFSFNGYKLFRFPAIALFLLIFLTETAFSQGGILDSAFTFRAGKIKTGNALDIITRRTG